MHKSYFNPQKQRQIKFEKSVIFSRWIYSERSFFLLCPDSWLHEITLCTLILTKATGKKALWAKRLIMSQKKYQQLHWAMMNCFLTQRKVFFILPDKTYCWWRAKKPLAPQWTVQRCPIKHLSRQATITHLLC